MFEGHFPGYPIMPGVLLIETMAQTGGWLVLAAHGCAKMAFLIQVEKAKMRIVRAARPDAGGRGQPAARRLRLRGRQGQHHRGREESDRSRNPLRYRPVPERSPEGGDAGNRPPRRPARAIHVQIGELQNDA